MTLIYDLDPNLQLPIEIIGNKAHGLLLLLKNEINVPQASILTTQAYQYFLEFRKNNHLLPSNSCYSFKWPPLLLKEIKEIFSRYQDQNLLPLAVRSSGIAEDKQYASYAGQLHTELNVKNFDHLLIAILQCWESSLSDSYNEYHYHNSATDNPPEMAIIIQQMLDPLVSGVMFTIHPVVHDLSKLIIEANRGLAKNVVDGQYNCERYIFDKISKQFNYETSILNQSQPFLLPQEARELFKLGLKTQDFFKWPQDIEWSIVQDCNGSKIIYLLQSRPITTLYYPKADKIYGY